MPTAPIPQKALESANPTAQIKVHQAVEVNVETEVKHNCSRNSTIENSAEIDLPNYKLREFENAEEDSTFGMLIWTDVVEVDRDAQRNSKWINNFEVQIKEVDSFMYGRKMGGRIRRMFSHTHCLRRIGRLMLNLPRCFSCRLFAGYLQLLQMWAHLILAFFLYHLARLIVHVL